MIRGRIAYYVAFTAIVSSLIISGCMSVPPPATPMPTETPVSTTAMPIPTPTPNLGSYYNFTWYPISQNNYTNFTWYPMSHYNYTWHRRTSAFCPGNETECYIFKCANNIYSIPGGGDRASDYINGSSGEEIARCGGNIMPLNSDQCPIIDKTCDYSKIAGSYAVDI